METQPHRPPPAPQRPSPGGSHAAAPRAPAGAELERLLDATPRAWLRRVPGRETFAWPQGGVAGEPVWIVKRFAGLGLREGLVELCAGGRLRSPARREAENLAALRADGLDVPRPLALLERGARSVLVMERVAHGETLAERLARAPRPERRRLAARLAEDVARLHRGGWFHRDLYLVHWILAEVEAGAPERPVLLDVGRARRRGRPRRRWFVKDLAALLHSVPGSVGPRERRAFLLRYLRGRGLALGEAPAWARRVERKRARIAGHVPRHDGSSRRLGEAGA